MTINRHPQLSRFVGWFRDHRADRLDDAHLLARYPDVGEMTDEEILAVAEAHLSRIDPGEADMHRVKSSLFRLRNQAWNMAVGISAGTVPQRPAGIR